tara:strand:- start:1520 stop:1840 length:321 start_codon:yes stop_codon:yes gene_type:complete
MSSAIKTGSLVVCVDESAYGVVGRVGKVFARVKRKNVYEQKETMVLFKLNYNGQHYIIPLYNVRRATDEEKQRDKRNPVYWKDTGRTLVLSKITHERKTRTIFPFN